MKVRIKTWEEMEKEFGLTASGSIGVRAGFNTAMEKLMPKDRVITVGNKDKDGDFIWEIENSVYFISNVMIEEFEPSTPVISELALAEDDLGDPAEEHY